MFPQRRRFKHKIELTYDDFVVLNRMLTDLDLEGEEEVKVYRKIQDIVRYMKERYALRLQQQEKAS